MLNKIAERVGAVAAINGSFIQSGNSIDSAVDLLMADGLILSESGHRCTSI